MIIFIILKQKNNLIKNLILNKEYFQEKEDLVKLKNVKVINFLQLKIKLNMMIIMNQKNIIIDIKVKVNIYLIKI